LIPFQNKDSEKRSKQFQDLTRKNETDSKSNEHELNFVDLQIPLNYFFKKLKMINSTGT